MDRREGMDSKKLINRILIVLFLLIFVICAGVLIRNFMDGQKEKDQYEEMSGKVDKTKEPTVTEKPQTQQSASLNGITIPDMKTLTELTWEKMPEVNSDIYSWIHIPETSVNDPVLQSAEQEDFYLDHGLDGETSKAGALYTQQLNKKDYSDRNTVIYGHNMKNGTMFHTLHDFKEEEFFNKSRYIFVYMPERTLVYEIYAACDVSNEHLLYKYDFSTDEGTKAFLADIKASSQSYDHVRADMEVADDAKLLTLSTCVPGGDDNFRWIVVGVLLGEAPAQTQAGGN